MCLHKKRWGPGMLMACLALSFAPASQANDLKDALRTAGRFLKDHGDEVIGAYTLYEWYTMTERAIREMDELALSIANAKDVPEFEKAFGGRVSSNDTKELRQKLTMVLSIGRQMEPYLLFLEKKANKETSPLEVRFFVLKSDIPNAFAFIADGYRRVCITLGLVKLFKDNADMIAGVLAHECGHHYLGHNLAHTKYEAKRELERQGAVLVLELLNKIKKFMDPKDIKKADVVVAVVQQFFSLRRSREDEAASDEFGVLLIFLSGFYKYGLTRAFEEMVRQSGDTPKFLVWVSSHPIMKDRIAATKKIADGLPERPPPSNDGPRIVRTARPWELGVSAEAARLRQQEGRRIAQGKDSYPSDQKPSTPDQPKPGPSSNIPATSTLVEGVGSEVARKLLSSRPGDQWTELPALPQDLVEHAVNVHSFYKDAQPPVPLRVYKASCLRRNTRVFLNVLVVRVRTDIEKERVFVWIPKSFQLGDAWQFHSR